MFPLQSMTIDELIEQFESLEDWEEQCDYLIDIGFDLPKLPDEHKIEPNKVHGCQSNVWLVANTSDGDSPVVEIQAESDAMIVNGLIAVLLAAYSGRTPQEILDTDIKAIFARLGLDRHLSPARRNGLFGMVKKIRSIAEQAA